MDPRERMHGTPTMTGLHDRDDPPARDDEHREAPAPGGSRFIQGEHAVVGDGQLGSENLARDDERNPEGTHDIARPIDRPTGA